MLSSKIRWIGHFTIFEYRKKKSVYIYMEPATPISTGKYFKIIFLNNYAFFLPDNLKLYEWLF